MVDTYLENAKDFFENLLNQKMFELHGFHFDIKRDGFASFKKDKIGFKYVKSIFSTIY